MHQFNIVIRSVQEVQDFVSLAMVQPFDVLVGSDEHRINGKNFMSMFTLDFRAPLQVSIQCSDEEYASFRKQAATFLT